MTNIDYNSKFAAHQKANTVILQATEEVQVRGVIIPKGYVNATQLCKANKKKLNDWTRLKRSNAYLEALSADTGIPVSGLIIEILGGGDGKGANFQGTFVHPEVAIAISAWISPEFEVWGNRVLRAVINNDFLALTSEAEKAQQNLQKIWDEIRETSIEVRNDETDAVAWYMQNNELPTNYSQWIYPNISDAVNKAVFNKTAKQLCEERQCDRNKLRATHTAKDLQKIIAIERHAEKLIRKLNTEPLQAIKEAIEFYS